MNQHNPPTPYVQQSYTVCGSKLLKAPGRYCHDSGSRFIPPRPTACVVSCRSRTEGPFQGKAFRLYPERYRQRYNDARFKHIADSTIDVSGQEAVINTVGSTHHTGWHAQHRMQQSL